jgi:nitroimidazol reductase NimA-like FMN-containing flavoprotein (pyridoxamine 5'-phosphate oxidase superfamily)
VTQRKIESLTRAECFELLTQKLVGRLAFVDGDGPAAIPVNYGMAGEQIVFRVEQGSHLREVLAPGVAFEVDHLEPDAGSGWSVLVRGTGHELDMDQVPDLLRHMQGHTPGPWAEGIHNVWMAIEPHMVTGRRLAAPLLGDVF